MNNLQQIMQMGQQLQTRMTKLQESLGSQQITASSGGGDGERHCGREGRREGGQDRSDVRG